MNEAERQRGRDAKRMIRRPTSSRLLLQGGDQSMLRILFRSAASPAKHLMLLMRPNSIGWVQQAIQPDSEWWAADARFV